MAREATQLVRDTESDLLFHHSSRVYYWAALAGQRRELKVDRELLYIGLDGAFAAQDFMRQYGVSQADIDKVWTAIALHTTPGIPEFMAPEIALVTAGVEMDVLGIDYDKFSDDQREQVVKHHPRPAAFKEEIIQAFYDGIKSKPTTTFGNVKADVIRDKEPGFEPLNFCSIIRASRWAG
ncbi:hypothetical protein BBAD15_g860 [Beauveria bassiana D1-5]|uniref:HD domain-containing protein n=1 Tax=Beauveria bassiana D1-5 TaxID=1245745 RepID=A0A0A2WJP7_BEABA|nr:hypothetical protein BBAD15_g860 [Beauveria bassiana D1-5]